MHYVYTKKGHKFPVDTSSLTEDERFDFPHQNKVGIFDDKQIFQT